MTKASTLGLALILLGGTASAAGLDADRRTMAFDALDMQKVAAEDALNDVKGTRYRFAIAHTVKINPAAHGAWTTHADGSTSWTFDVDTPDAAHLNFGFEPFRLPDGARLSIVSPDGDKLTYDGDDATAGQLWTAIVKGATARLTLDVPAGKAGDVELALRHVGHGYRGFGATAKHCKSGACNLDVACLAPDDPWNAQRRAAGTYTVGGRDTCSGSLVNNTANDRRMLFATATHCGVSDDAIGASVVMYWNYESPTCRTPGSASSGQALPKPATSQSGARFLAATADFRTMPASAFNSDFTLLELTQQADPALNLHWVGWDRRDAASHACAAPADPAATDGLCASIHHPNVDEKRITFVEADLARVDFDGGIASHYHANWDPTPPILPGIQPPPASVVPNVTEPGSSGSPLFDAERRLVGVLSGGPSACGATGANLSDYYGRLASAWEGGGTPQTAMKTHLDPVGGGAAQFLDDLGQCNAPAAPTNVAATASGANAATVTWDAVPGISTYRVLRADGACPGGVYQRIGEVNN
ncbi:MAG TPA: hypothetical protein VJ724_13485, partial [Tahibacter sp.]|nr:hypothetical protein [Tahibacter sp.]